MRGLPVNILISPRVWTSTKWSLDKLDHCTVTHSTINEYTNNKERSLTTKSNWTKPAKMAVLITLQRLCRLRWVQATALVLVLLLLYFYWTLLQDHGTFAPWFALYYTAQGPYIPPRPAGYKPTTRFVVSLTTMPGDVEHLDEVLMSLSNQTVKPAAIYVNLPQKNRRTGAPYVIPDWLRKFPNVQILQPATDYGPMTKLYPALEKETDPETVIISVDDDKVGHTPLCESRNPPVLLNFYYICFLGSLNLRSPRNVTCFQVHLL